MFSVVDAETMRSMAGFPKVVKHSLQSVLDELKSKNWGNFITACLQGFHLSKCAHSL